MYNIVVFASGNGSTLQSIIDAIKSKDLEAHIPLVVSNNPKAFALKRAKKAKIPTYVIKEKDADKERIEYLTGLNILLQSAIEDLKYDLGKA